MIFRRRRHPVDEATLNAFVDEQLDAQERARVQAHAGTCSSCRETVAELVALRQTLAELPPASAPRSFALREADVRAAATPRPAGAWGRAPTALSGVAMAAFLAFAVLVGVDVLGRPAGDESGSTAGYTQSGGPLEVPPAKSADGGKDAEQPSADAFSPGLSDSATQERAAAVGQADSRSATPQPATPQPTSTPRAAGEAADGDENAVDALRIAQAATAALALTAGGSLAFVRWRRRSVP